MKVFSTRKVSIMLVLAMMLVLVGCGAPAQTNTPATEEPATIEPSAENEGTPESTEGEPATPVDPADDQEEEPVSDRPAFAQIDWGKYTISDKEITFLGKPGNEITLDDVLEAYPEGLACLRENSFARVTKDDIYEVEDYLRMVDKEGKDDLHFFLSDDLHMYDDNETNVQIDFAMYGEDILLSEAMASDCWALSVYSSIPVSACLRPIGIEFVKMSVGGGGVDPSYHAAMLTEFMDKYGAPTGLLYSKEVGEFFGPETGNPYAGTKYDTSYILYWDRDTYVVAISIDEWVSKDGLWLSSIDNDGIFYMKAAWENIVACETNPNNPYYSGWELVPFEDFGELYTAANEIANYPR